MFSNISRTLNSNKYKKWTLLSFWLLVLSLSWLVEAKAEEKPVGMIIGVTGEILYRSTTDTPVASKDKLGETKLASFSPWEKVKFKQPVYAKDEFKTSKRSRLKIKFSDNSLMALGPNSKMEVSKYVYNKKKNLRQGVMKISYGLSMYIVNKTQKNKKSNFNLISPTANLAARGTQGYVSSSDKVTYLANQAGAMDSSSSDPNIKGSQTVGAMKKNSIEAGKPPTVPTDLTNNDLAAVRNVVMGQIGASSALIKDLTQTVPTQSEPEKSKESDSSKESSDQKSGSDKKSKEADDSNNKKDSEDSKSAEKSSDSKEKGDTKKEGDSEESEEGDSESSESSEGGDSSEGGGDDSGGDSADSGGDSGGDSSSSSDSGGGDSGSSSGGGDSGGGFSESFTATGSSGGGGGGGSDFSPVNNPFSPAALSSCSG
jgi:hypothetical protein